ncbi:MAG: four helix bundle protein [Zoogloeaceae bacterium]|nr:four helix bundle protein [Zoogloeaceae bacterium]
MSGYRDLKVWQAAMQLAEAAYRLSAAFPKHEVYGLVSQIRRSAVSVPSNIAEGHGRNSLKEFVYFLGVALGSLAELETQLMLSCQVGYLKQEAINAILQISDETGKMIRGLQKSLTSTTN